MVTDYKLTIGDFLNFKQKEQLWKNVSFKSQTLSSQKINKISTIFFLFLLVIRIIVLIPCFLFFVFFVCF